MKKLTRDYVLYGVGNIGRQIASIVMLPIYTRFLTPADYGAVELATLITMAVSLLAGMNLGDSIFRFYHDAPDAKGKKQVIATALLIALVVNSAAALLLVVASPVLNEVFLSDEYSPMILVIYSVMLVTESWYSIPMTQMRADGQAVRFVMSAMAKLFMQIALNLYFVVYLRMGAMGVAYAAIIASVLSVAMVLPYSAARAGFRASRTVSRQLVGFGLPLAFANIAGFYLASSDRFFLEHSVGLAKVGVYVLAAKLAQAFMMLIYDPFEQIWDSEKYRIWYAHRDIGPLQQVFRLTSLALLVAGSGAAIFSHEIFTLLATPAYAGASRIAPILIASSVCVALTRYCRMGSLVSGRTGDVTKAACISAVLVTVLLAVLVPAFGMEGAAFAVLGSSAARLWIEHQMAKRHLDMQLDWKLFFGVATASVLAYVFCAALAPDGFLGMLIKLLLWVTLAAVLWYSPALRSDDRSLVYGLIRTRTN